MKPSTMSRRGFLRSLGVTTVTACLGGILRVENKLIVPTHTWLRIEGWTQLDRTVLGVSRNALKHWALAIEGNKDDTFDDDPMLDFAPGTLRLVSSRTIPQPG